MPPLCDFGVKLKSDLGTCMSILLALPSLLRLRALATTPTPVSTNAWPLEPALEPKRGISLRAWKFRGLRPRTTIGDVMASARVTLVLSGNVPNTLRCRTKCCWSSFLRPLLAVALKVLSEYVVDQGRTKSEKRIKLSALGNLHPELEATPADGINGKLSFTF